MVRVPRRGDGPRLGLTRDRRTEDFSDGDWEGDLRGLCRESKGQKMRVWGDHAGETVRLQLETWLIGSLFPQLHRGGLELDQLLSRILQHPRSLMLRKLAGGAGLDGGCPSSPGNW